MVTVGTELVITVAVNDTDGDEVMLRMLSDNETMSGSVNFSGNDSAKSGEFQRILTWTPEKSSSNGLLR